MKPDTVKRLQALEAKADPDTLIVAVQEDDGDLYRVQGDPQLYTKDQLRAMGAQTLVLVVRGP